MIILRVLARVFQVTYIALAVAALPWVADGCYRLVQGTSFFYWDSVYDEAERQGRSHTAWDLWQAAPLWLPALVLGLILVVIYGAAVWMAGNLFDAVARARRTRT